MGIPGDFENPRTYAEKVNFRKLYGPNAGQPTVILRAKPDVPIEEMQREVEAIMRIRHDLRHLPARLVGPGGNREEQQ